LKFKIFSFILIFYFYFTNPLCAQIDSNQIDSLAGRFVKQHCCNKGYIITDTELISPDSNYIFRIKNSSLYLIQVYYSNYNIYGSVVYLVNFDQNSYQLLDSICFYRHDDLFIPRNIVYIDSVDWFYGYSEGWGSGFYSEWKQVFKVENNQIITLFEYPEYASQMNFERNNRFCSELNVKVISMYRDTVKLLLIQNELFVLFNKYFTYKKTKQELILFFDSEKNRFIERSPVNPQIYLWVYL
jgi:hypothetical protein